MNRRSFISLLAGGIAAGAAVRTFPFRVYSFPSDIVIAPVLDTPVPLLVDQLNEIYLQVPHWPARGPHPHPIPTVPSHGAEAWMGPRPRRAQRAGHTGKQGTTPSQSTPCVVFHQILLRVLS